ncbi:MAG TPA: ribosome maturation factor RimP [Planctomycetota bacterium]|nr:ribosome maturation factor RimP [Planctomycetota bacterium]
MSSLEDTVVGIARKTVVDTGFETVQVKVDGRRHMRIWIDRDPEGVKVDDCVRVNRAVQRALGDEGIDSGAFHVEVLSPGLDRVLTRDKDFTRFAGALVVVHLAKKRGDRRKFKGRLLGLLEGKVAIKNEDPPHEDLAFTKDEIDEVRLVPNLK